MNNPSIPRNQIVFAREKLCQKIATLDKDATIDDIKELFKGFALPICPDDSDGEGTRTTCSSNNEKANSSNKHDNMAVTPLMVACGKGQLSFLNYLTQNYKDRDGNDLLTNTQIIGDCLHASSTDGNNQAVHYAASFPQALQYLSQIFIAQQSIGRNQDGLLPLSQFQVDFKLLSQVNDHGDTPFMMAAAGGDKFAIQFWVQQLLSSSSPSSSSPSPSVSLTLESAHDIKQMLAMENTANDTALSLAYGYGNCEVVEYLISTESSCNNNDNGGSDERNHEAIDLRSRLKLPLIHATYQDIQRVKATLEKFQNTESRVPADKMQEFKKKQQHTQQCLVLLQVASAKHAEQVSKSLLNEDETLMTRIKNTKKKSKQKRKNYSSPTVKAGSDVGTRIYATGNENNTNGEERGPPAKEELSEGDATTITRELRLDEKLKIDTNIHDQDPITKPKVFTMEDGTIVSDHRNITNMDQATSPSAILHVDEKSIQHLLRERCDDTLSHKSEEVMESLCLDASMLLLSPHALAMKLSPSQLEAVEVVLKNQLDAVVQAKEIHSRLLGKSSNGGSC
jgi:ankyrin repeat protein